MAFQKEEPEQKPSKNEQFPIPKTASFSDILFDGHFTGPGWTRQLDLSEHIPLSRIHGYRLQQLLCHFQSAKLRHRLTELLFHIPVITGAGMGYYRICFLFTDSGHGGKQRRR
jgi:hypothetical protein